MNDHLPPSDRPDGPRPSPRPGPRPKPRPDARPARDTDARPASGPVPRRSLPAPLALGSVIGVALLVSLTWWLVSPSGDGPSAPGPEAAEGGTEPPAGVVATTAPASTQRPTSTVATTTTRPPYAGWVDPASTGSPYPKATTVGITTFRGNPTRSWYGTGPMPKAPQVLWSYPASGGLCGESNDGKGTQTWCGTGWNGQPSVWEYNGRTWLAVGAYDYGVHFLDVATGRPTIPALKTGDLAKGTVTVDPDGFPLLYHGSRDNKFRVVAFDRDTPTVLWSLDAYAFGPVLWNDDWDGSPLVIDDYLFQGGENGRLFAIKLNRSLGPDGKVRVAPEVVWNAKGWDDEMLAVITDKQNSFESSVAISGNTLYAANSGGLVQGWDISGLKNGVAPTRVFRFWTGDDTDATIVVDDEGFLYVGSEWERRNERSRTVGQFMKLDPRKPDNPLVWSIADQGSAVAGIWATAALHRDMVYVPTDGGQLLGIDRATGAVRWRKSLAGPTWQSPVVVDDVLVQGDCSGMLRGYDVRDTRIDPPLLWSLNIGGCIESTPAVWNGRIYVGTRAGRIHAVGDR
jgi:hypothetical protein